MEWNAHDSFAHGGVKPVDLRKHVFRGIFAQETAGNNFPRVATDLFQQPDFLREWCISSARERNGEWGEEVLRAKARFQIPECIVVYTSSSVFFGHYCKALLCITVKTYKTDYRDDVYCVFLTASKQDY